MITVFFFISLENVHHYSENASTRIDENVGQQAHVLVTRTSRVSGPECDCSNVSAASQSQAMGSNPIRSHLFLTTRG